MHNKLTIISDCIVSWPEACFALYFIGEIGESAPESTLLIILTFIIISEIVSSLIYIIFF